MAMLKLWDVEQATKEGGMNYPPQTLCRLGKFCPECFPPTKGNQLVNLLTLGKYLNTNTRSFVISVAVVAITAGVETLDTQLTTGKFNWGVVGGAAVAATVKFVHSALTRRVIQSAV